MKRFACHKPVRTLPFSGQWRFNQSRTPTKVFKYSYMPDPRKFTPVETVSEEELFPMPLRPPHEEVPDVATFLERISITRQLRCNEHAGVFRDWEHLMCATVKEMKALGVPPNVAGHISQWQKNYRRGEVPRLIDRAPMEEYWAQFQGKRKCQRGAKVIFPDVPENYRPHQQGIVQRPVKDLVAANMMPPWVRELEEKQQKRK